jgi:hypothetical protein
MTGFQPRMEILPAGQQAFWPHLSGARKLGFVLYGGTAIALRLGHRTSIDFDFFTDRPLDHRKLSEAFSFLKRSEVIHEEPDTLTLVVPLPGKFGGSVKVSYFGGLSFGRVGIPDVTPDGVLEIASLNDLLATKVKVVLQRIEAKDYRDVAAIVRAGVRLETGLAAARVLFESAFQPAESLRALSYFEGGDLKQLSDEDRALLIETVRNISEIPLLQKVATSLSGGSR